MAAAPSTTTDLITVRIVDPAVGDFSLILPQHAQNHLHDALDAGLFQNAEQMQIFLNGIVTDAVAAVSHATCHIGAAAKQLAEDADSRAATEQMSEESFVLWAQEVFGGTGVPIMAIDTMTAAIALGVDTFDPSAAEDEMDAGR